VVVHVRGPIFDGRAEREVTALLRDAQEQVAAQGSSILHGFMDATFKNPTPYYETQVTTDSRAGDLVVNDRGIVYGPWLEGIGTRNRTTRFKGYRNWRRARQELARQAPDLVARVARKYILRMGGS
jgi:hypothetical protein